MKSNIKITCSNCGASNPTNSKYCTACGYELPNDLANYNNSDNKLKTYNFEYTDRRLVIKLLLQSYAVFLTTFILIFYLGYIKAVSFIFILVIVLTILILWLNRKRIKLTGTACIHHNAVELNLKNFNETIQYSNIKSYMVQVYQGLSIRLVLNDGSKLRIDANRNFCNPEQFSLFCSHLEKTLNEFQLTNKVELTREKSLFEKKWMFYLLVLLSALLALLVVFSIVVRRKTPATIVVSAGAIATLWAAYYTTKQRNK